MTREARCAAHAERGPHGVRTPLRNVRRQAARRATSTTSPVEMPWFFRQLIWSVYASSKSRATVSTDADLNGLRGRLSARAREQIRRARSRRVHGREARTRLEPGRPRRRERRRGAVLVARHDVEPAAGGGVIVDRRVEALVELCEQLHRHARHLRNLVDARVLEAATLQRVDEPQGRRRVLAPVGLGADQVNVVRLLRERLVADLLAPDRSDDHARELPNIVSTTSAPTQNKMDDMESPVRGAVRPDSPCYRRGRGRGLGPG